MWIGPTPCIDASCPKSNPTVSWSFFDLLNCTNYASRLLTELNSYSIICCFSLHFWFYN